MNINWQPNIEPRSYKSVKNEKFNKIIQKADRLLQMIQESSLRDEDKKKIRKRLADKFKPV